MSKRAIRATAHALAMLVMGGVALVAYPVQAAIMLLLAMAMIVWVISYGFQD